MKIFTAYTLARLGLFLAMWGLIWLIFGRWIDEWNSITALWTALIAMVVSSLIALTALRGMRDKLASEVAQRAERMKAAQAERDRREDAEATDTDNPAS